MHDDHKIPLQKQSAGNEQRLRTLKIDFVKIFDRLPRFSVALQHIDLIPKFLGSEYRNRQFFRRLACIKRIYSLLSGIVKYSYAIHSNDFATSLDE
jgi:hypothetical protein